MKVLETAFVGYPVTDMKRARAFYEGTLGLAVLETFEHDGKAWIEYDTACGTFAITDMVPEWKPSPSGGSVAFEVEDYDEAISQLKAEGVVFLQETMESPVCRMAVVMDPEGNTLTIHKRKAG